MRLKLIIIAALVVIFGGSFLYHQHDISTQTTETSEKSLYEPLPDVGFQTLDGRRFKNFSALSEKTLIINFWASWCTPCVKELPALITKVQESNGRIGLVAISIDTTQKAAQDFINEHVGKELSHVYWVWDKNKALSLKQFNVLKVPETIIVNEQRQMIEKIVGEADFSKY